MAHLCQAERHIAPLKGLIYGGEACTECVDQHIALLVFPDIVQHL